MYLSVIFLSTAITIDALLLILLIKQTIPLLLFFNKLSADAFKSLIGNSSNILYSKIISFKVFLIDTLLSVKILFFFRLFNSLIIFLLSKTNCSIFLVICEG